MSNLSVLNNIDHHDLKVVTQPSSEYGDKVGAVVVFPGEFSQIQREYPILFQRHPDTDELNAVALLGFKQDENLFLQKNEWRGDYIPAATRKGPFLIGFQDQRNQGGDEKEPVIMVDTDDARINTKNGEALFLENGGNAPYLQELSATLQLMHQGMELKKSMFTAFEKFELLEPVSIDIEFINEERIVFQSYLTINLERLGSLAGDALEELNKNGFLQAAYLCVASLNNIQRLADKRNLALQQE